VDAHRDDGKRFVVHADEKLTAFVELESVIRAAERPEDCGAREIKMDNCRGWLNNTTITLGVNNLMDLEPPFVAGAIENGYDEATANIKGRTCYVALKKRF
jgi:hypothetical protein